MKQNYNPEKLSKKQRHMKKWIPDGLYCEGMGIGKHPNPCPFWHSLWNEDMKDKTYIHKRGECYSFGTFCDDDCRNAKLESIAYDYEDEPLLFVCKDNNGELCLCECAECRFPRTWLIGRTTIEVLYDLINKKMTIRDALTFKKCILIREDINGKYVILQDFDEQLLPKKDSKMMFCSNEFCSYVLNNYN